MQGIGIIAISVVDGIGIATMACIIAVDVAVIAVIIFAIVIVAFGANGSTGRRPGWKRVVVGVAIGVDIGVAAVFVRNWRGSVVVTDSVAVEVVVVVTVTGVTDAFRRSCASAAGLIRRSKRRYGAVVTVTAVTAPKGSNDGAVFVAATVVTNTSVIATAIAVAAAAFVAAVVAVEER